jgi:hypothetical protein
MKRAQSTTGLLALVALVLVGCGLHAADGTPIATDGTLTGAISELADPGSTYKARQAAEDTRQAADDAKCREYGFKPGTEGYGNCRLQLDQIRATKQAAAVARPNDRPSGANTTSTTTSYLDATTGKLVTCSGTATSKTCF